MGGYMEKAYSFSDLAKKLESAGVPVLKEAAEETAKQVYSALKEWLNESAALSETRIDDVIVPFISQLDSIVLAQVDKIDGEAD